MMTWKYENVSIQTMESELGTCKNFWKDSIYKSI